jgi:hypothetical protein
MPAGEAWRLTMIKVLYVAVVCSLVFAGCCAECRYYNSEPACQKAKLVCDKVASERTGKKKGAQVSETQKARETECESAQQGCRQVLIQKGLIKKPQP